MSERCRGRHTALRLRCERNVRHPGSHRAETGEPPYRLKDGTLRLPMAVWLDAPGEA